MLLKYQNSAEKKKNQVFLWDYIQVKIPKIYKSDKRTQHFTTKDCHTNTSF